MKVVLKENQCFCAILQAVIKISDISPIYRISVPIDTIFAIKNCSVEKSKKIDKISLIYRPGTDILVDFFALSDTCALGEFFSISRRYIGDISVVVCVAKIDPAEDPTVNISPPFQRLV